MLPDLAHGWYSGIIVVSKEGTVGVFDRKEGPVDSLHLKSASEGIIGACEVTFMARKEL